jgi:tRNA (guanine37-N1)-methyltransferase
MVAMAINRRGARANARRPSCNAMKGNLKTALERILPREEAASIYKSYDVVGDLAIIRIPEHHLPHSALIAETLMQQHKHVKSVWRQSSPVSGAFRLRELRWVAGERRTETIHREHGCLFKVDVQDCYFSPRLGFERMRIARLVETNEVVVNMFAGVGCYSITIAKHSAVARVYSIDINPTAVKYTRENVLLNKVVDKVIAIEGDARSIIEGQLESSANRVLMPLPERAAGFLDSALLALKPRGGWIHYYGFEHASKEEDPIAKAKAKAESRLHRAARFEMPLARMVRQTGPNWYQVAVDILVKEKYRT